MQAAYDDVLERLKGQSNELLAALGGSPGCVTLGSADETALSQVGRIGLCFVLCVLNHLLCPLVVCCCHAKLSLHETSETSR